MQKKVLVVEQSAHSLSLMSKLVKKAGLQPVGANSLSEAEYKFRQSMPEEFLCAVVDYHLPDAKHGEALDFAINAYLPTIAVTDNNDTNTRNAVLARQVVDYIPKENGQIYDYLSRLLARLEKNKVVGVLVVDSFRHSRQATVSLLKRHHFLIYEAAGAEEAVEALDLHSHIQLIIIGDSIEDAPSTDFISNLRKEYSTEELAIIGVSDSESGLLSAHYIKSGANDVLRKPYCYEEFMCRITQNLELIDNVNVIREAANKDFLTGLPNRRHFFYSVNHSFKNLPAKQALALLDLDFFKLINDTYGHDAGDYVLKHVAKLIAQAFDDVFVARFGGEEFCIYLPLYSAEKAYTRLEMFRKLVEGSVIVFDNTEITVTTSIGLSTRPSHNIEALLSDADKLLYEAKAHGRNQICVRDE
ncbi:diguanylate cyclase [Alteromonas sp. ASW11-130]|uniref:diguanylate cyclase n=1 Tax=Alteromonas sp. ASW11-130 TaxID=3015775 RepID=UPI0022425349|nr:diguanylate cyclase [Alteromonas sp. ASW11-130]MCW8091071.1 diguanylate cyclase [Alteromonas sp. ASW11-130]